MLRHLPQLFRGPFLRKLANGDYYLELAERLKSGNLEHLLSLPMHSIFDSVYDILLARYRCEYVFKNSLSHRFLSDNLHRPSIHITDEFRVGNNRVDLAVFSETSIAYEIKTEFDSSFRLHSQASEYVKLFDEVYVVTTEKFRPKIEGEIPRTVGILELVAGGELRTIRQSESHASLTNLCVAFDCLRQDERTSIVETISNARISVPSSKRYVECKKLFRRLLPFEAQRHFLSHLRARRLPEATEGLLSEVPVSLKHAALTLRASKRDVERIRAALRNTPQKPPTKPNKNNAYLLPTSTRKAKRNVSSKTVATPAVNG